MKRIMLSVAVFAFLCLGGIVQANVFDMSGGVTSLELVTVGNPGNAGEISGNGGWAGPVGTCGAVDYVYKIGKYEVTTAQYAEFLNAVAKTDTYGLYKVGLEVFDGHHIARDGTEGNYTYSVNPGWENRPINYINWGDAIRFINWLHNGQPTGNQDATTTEDGAYYINGATSNAGLLAVTRKSGWKYALPSENEWYKAAYHKNDGATGNYWDYATQSDSAPGRDFNGTNDANWYDSANGGYLVPPYYRNIVGEFVNCPSAYGTFDMCGNTWEWDEAIGLKSDGLTSVRGSRGGSYALADHYMWSIARYFMYDPIYAHQSFGLRIVANPETLLKVTLSGTIVLQNFPGDPSTISAVITVGTTDHTVILDANGNFTVADLTPGIYDVKVKAAHWLAKRIPNVDLTADRNIGSVSLINGDLDGDNEVSSTDLSTVLSSLGMKGEN